MTSHKDKTAAASTNVDPTEGDTTAADDQAAKTNEDGTPDLGAPGSIVRLDDPDEDGDPRYALVVNSSTLVPLETARGYQLPVYQDR